MSAAKAVKDPLRRGRVCNTDSLNVRDTHAASGKKLKSLAAGVVVGVYSETAGWVKIDPKAALWVNKKYLEPVAV
ncbi:MAG: SH3 domain-containing protein [Permianibacter sp.]